MFFTNKYQALEAWESTVLNLGHCHRKLGSLDEAASCYLRIRELSPQRHSVHSALALTHHLQVCITPGRNEMILICRLAGQQRC